MKNVSILILMAIILIALSIIAFVDIRDRVSSQDKKLKFIELKQGTNTEIEREQQKIIKSPEEWSDLWTEMFPTEMIAPATDFSKKDIIAVFMGRRNTGGYSIKIKEVIDKEEYIEIHVEEYSPSENCFVTQVLTNPYNIIEIQKFEKEAKFIFNEKKIDCS